MEEEVIILSVKKYDFQNSSGEQVSGCTIHYYPSATFDTVENTEDNVLGLQPNKTSFPIEFYDRAKKFGIPCSAKIHYVMRSVQGQKILKVDSIDFIKG